MAFSGATLLTFSPGASEAGTTTIPPPASTEPAIGGPSTTEDPWPPVSTGVWNPVSEIINDYVAYERPNRPEGSSEQHILDETMAGLREYFDKSLGRILLYR